MAIDWNKPLQTRDGREVRIYARDGESNWPVHGAIRQREGWRSSTWKANGTYFLPSDVSDLVNVPEKIILEFFIVVLNDGTKLYYDDEDGAILCLKRHGLANVRAVFRVRYDESDGLSITQTFKPT